MATFHLLRASAMGRILDARLLFASGRSKTLSKCLLLAKPRWSFEALPHAKALVYML